MKMYKNKKLKKNGRRLRVIQITGLRGILSAIFVVTCLAAGFIGFPAVVIYKFWNYIAAQTYAVPSINLFQGLILWGILAVSYIIVNEKKNYFIAFEPKTVSGKDIAEIIKEIKAQRGDFSQPEELSERQNKNTIEEEEKKEDKI